MILFGHRKIRIRTSILAYFLFGTAVITATLLAFQAWFQYRAALEITQKEFAGSVSAIAAEMRSRDRFAREVLNTLALMPGLAGLPVDKPDLPMAERFADILRRNPTLYAIYLGKKDGSLFELVNLDCSPRARSVHDAPARARWLLIRVLWSGGKGKEYLDYYDAGFRHISTRVLPRGYKSYERPWYRLAVGKKGVRRSPPYLFGNRKQWGISYSKDLGGGTVLALDVTTSRLKELLESLRFNPTVEMALFDGEGHRLAATEGMPRKLTELFRQKIRSDKRRRIFAEEGIEAAGGRFAMVEPIGLSAGEPLWIGIAVDEKTMLEPYLEKIFYSLAVALAFLFLSYFFIRELVRRIVRPIYALMRENDKIKNRQFDRVKRVETNIVELDELSQSLWEISESIRSYQQKQKELLDSFIRLIADAIDAKSPYTGGHCQRVPVIAEKLLKEICASDDPGFSSFTMTGRESWEEFRRAAWLHDCGKITTPEFVVNKATKLETIYDRIHEIRTRFEVLWRDEEIRCLEAKLSGEEPEKAERKKERAQAELLEEFDFVARVNIGSEEMSEEKMERIHRIARRRWMRHFDNRLGLCAEERDRMEGDPVALPAEEPLLADRPEHRIPRPRKARPADSPRFTLQPPELLYDRGELHNLCIRRGTLTPEEYYKIQEHVVMTIDMLEKLPWPEEMRRIPDYAGNHHERLDGKGYPRSLTAEELPIPSRVMAIADVFEALTASDRPYKQGKTLSATLEIMVSMANEGHLDGEILALFIRRGVYREYAQAYLPPRQVDEVDEERLLGKLRETKE